MAGTLGFAIQGVNRKACLLNQMIYGLQQMPHAWFKIFNAALLKVVINEVMLSHQLREVKESGSFICLCE